MVLAPFAVVLVGCNHEEAPVPLSPQAQEALKSGHTGIPTGVTDVHPGQGSDTARGARK